MAIFKDFDRSGREPRRQQEIALDFIENNLNLESDETETIAVQAPVATGKSGILKALQYALPTWIITSANTLLDQYAGDYPTDNIVKGISNYECHNTAMNCSDWAEIKGEACLDCPYRISKSRAKCGDATVFNPMSLFYNLRELDKPENPRPLITAGDEAHQLISMLQMVSGVSFKDSKYKLPDDCENMLVLVPWLKAKAVQLKELKALYIKNGKKELIKPISEEWLRINNTVRSIGENEQNYAVYTEVIGKETILNVRPVKPPRWITNAVLGQRKRVLMSGTLFQHDIEDLIGASSYKFLDLSSPIPKERRPVYLRPLQEKMNYQTDPRIVVKAIETILDARVGVNTIIHVSYSLQKRLLPHFTRPVLHNTSENKAKVIEKFKKEGGIFLASGCAEGLDLKGDLCRVNIIPQLLFPNRMDPIVKKRLALPGGERWYLLETLKTTIQQIGRTTRTIDDYSETFVLDPNFSRVVGDLKKMEHTSGKQLVPTSFQEQVIWAAHKF